MAEALATPAPRKPLRKRVWFRLLVLLGVIYLIWCAGLYFYQDRILFVGAFRENGAPPVPTLTINNTPVFLVAPEGAPKGLVVIFHGNDETAWQVARHSEAGFCTKHGWLVAVPEYRGFGGFPGSPSQDAFVTDIAPVVQALKARPELVNKPVVYLGYSLGGGVACAVGRAQPPDAIILRSSFTSVSRFAWRMGVPGFLVANPFDNEPFLRAFKGKVLIVHGIADQIVPVAHGRDMAKMAANSTLLEMKGDHFGFDKVALYRQAERTLLEEVLAAQGKP